MFLWRALSTVVATRSRHYFECRLDTPKGDLWLGTWLVPVSSEPTGPVALMGVAREISELILALPQVDPGILADVEQIRKAGERAAP